MSIANTTERAVSPPLEENWSTPSPKVHLIFLAALTALVAAIYWPCLGHDYINFDDPVYLFHNRAVSSPYGLGKIWSSVRMPEDCTNWPLVFTTYWLEYRFVEFRPWLYHLDNILLHALGAWLCQWWLRRLGIPMNVAMSAALLFAVHPINVNSVAWVTERKNVLSGVFFFASLGTYAGLARSDGRSWARSYSLYVLWTVCALLSKSSTVLIPFIALLSDVLLVNRAWMQRSLRLQIVPLALVGLACFHTVYSESKAVDQGWTHRLLAAPSAAWFYIEKYLLVGDYRLFYPPWRIDPTSWEWWWPPVATLLALVVAWRLRRREPVFSFGILYYFAMVFPVSGIQPFGWMKLSPAGNHLAYLPSVGLSLILAQLMFKVRPRRWSYIQPGWLLLALSIVPLSARAYQETWRWRDSPARLFDVDDGNDNYEVWSVKACWLVGDPNLESAAFHLLGRMAEDRPRAALPWMMQSSLFRRRGDLRSCEVLMRKAVALEPDRIDARVFLAHLLFQTNRPDEALLHIDQAFQVKPAPELYHAKATILLSKGEVQQSLETLKAAEALDPRDADTLFYLGMFHANRGQNQEAIDYFKKCLREEPNSPRCLEQLKKLTPPSRASF